ncbi:MAG: IS66 family transposase [Planctomycetes bacterium]|nr:IS66 family transposase [Planctomycetota bacterium]
MDASEINLSCSSCRRLWGELESLRTTMEQIHKQVAELQKQNTKLQRQNTKLQAEIDRLKKEREETEKNSKRQTTRFPRRQRKTQPKKPGRKKGTPATHRDRPAKVDREIDVPAGNCPDCCCAVENIEVHRQFQTDLPPVTPVTTQFNVAVGSCPRCGKRVQGRHPEQISDTLGAAGNLIGPNAQTMAAQLKHHAGLSYAKITNFMFDYFHLKTVASTFVRAGQRLARRAEPSFELLKSQLRLEHVVHADETGWRIGILLDWLWVFSSQQITVYQVGGGRGHDVPLDILGDEFQGILICDGLASYNLLPYLKGRCVGHVLARISKLEAALPDRHLWELQRIKGLLQEAMHLGRRREMLTAKGYWRRVRELENRLDFWILLNEERSQPDVSRLARHLQKHRHEWFMFLYDPLVPPTNNHAERMIRPAVIIRKLGGCNKTPAGAKVHSVLASLMVSCRQQGKRFLDLADQLFHAADRISIPLASLPDGYGPPQ